MASRSSSHRHQPYKATRNRKKRRNKTGVVFKSPDKKRIRDYSTGSWFYQENLEHTYKTLADISPISASRKKLIDYSSDESENGDDLFETEGEEEGAYKTDCWDNRCWIIVRMYSKSGCMQMLSQQVTFHRISKFSSRFSYKIFIRMSKCWMCTLTWLYFYNNKEDWANLWNE